MVVSLAIGFESSNRRGFAFTIAFQQKPPKYRIFSGHERSSGPFDVAVTSSPESQKETVSLMDKVWLGLKFSQNAPNNITAAENACHIWEDLFRSNERHPSALSPQVFKLAKTLYASCLVRIGRDSDAIKTYNECLRAFGDNTISTREDVSFWRLSKAKCHQRLLEYSHSLEEYLLVANQEQALSGATTCAMRLGNVSLAQHILSSDNKRESILPGLSSQGISEASFSLACLNAIIGYILDGDSTQAVDQLSQFFTKRDTRRSGMFLYQWVLCKLLGDAPNYQSHASIRHMLHSRLPSSAEERFMELIRINACPFDDPNLVYLDDKVELHEMLTTIRNDTSSFWPSGMILPTELPRLKQILTGSSATDLSSLWILKSKSGYGSHGNRILTLSEGVGEWGFHDLSVSETEPILLQQMVDPLYLLDGYKFSLRIYVVYFSSTEMYISTTGLVKVASKSLVPTTYLDSRMHLTNSGRESSMQQYNLDYLWKTLGKEVASALWDDICEVTTTVLLKYYSKMLAKKKDGDTWQSKGTQWNLRRENLGIPKILGLDFVVEDNCGTGPPKAWLVEVNRFPGLEPRDEMDRIVKTQVVWEAWKKAAERVDTIECAFLAKNWCVNTGTSLQRISLK
jgi:hypothetical protein